MSGERIAFSRSCIGNSRVLESFFLSPFDDDEGAGGRCLVEDESFVVVVLLEVTEKVLTVTSIKASSSKWC